MELLKTIALFTLVGISVILLTPLAVLAIILYFAGFRRAMSFCTYKIAQGWAWTFIRLVGCRLTVEGREHIIKEGGLCFVSNHGSIFDILLILALAGRPVGFIAKQELAWIPLLNMWILLLGGLFIDRRHTRRSIKRAIETIEAGIRRINAGGAMIIFPEGTRSRGRGLLPFKPGALKLATQAGAPINPLSITGSDEVFEKTGRIRAAPVRVVFGEPFYTADLSAEDRRKRLPDQVRERIAQGLAAGDTPEG
ncbi:MAG: 1-acyl-sn-glycerol-3-phosphate acyltransferase [Spirochaetaceae bacterium]|jgi:1-acyl-sn-glycerol-3-phosphate acyltransferase|nr:1-acyl-sn-glycerol-3-phosphate acyltransferase [Spirochaetaceae bacterium]